MDAVDVTRWFLGAFFLSVTLFYTLTILLKKQRLGRSPVIRGAVGSLHCRIHRVFVAFRAAILIICLVRIPWPAIDGWLIPFEPLWQPPIILAGDALMVISFLSIIAIHAYMGRDWRSGIAADGPERLITTGPFRLTRNPIFILIQLAQLGLFLAMPSLFTLICLIVGIAAIQAQTRLEETHLKQRYGESYRDYRSHTPRWLID